MEAKLCINQRTGRVLCMEAPRALLENLKDVHTRPFGEVLQSLEGGPGGSGKGSGHGSAIPLANLAEALGSRSGRGVDAPAKAEGAKLPRRAPVPKLSQPSLLMHSSTVLSYRTWPCGLERYTDKKAQQSNLQRVQVLSAKPEQDLDLNRPVMKCTTFSCPTYSNTSLLACPNCLDGIMGLNCSLPDAPGFEPEAGLDNPWPLTGQLVYQYPFLALAEEWKRGLSLKWEGAEGVAHDHGPFTIVRPGLSPCLGRPMHSCKCTLVHNPVMRGHDKCPSCGKRESWDITFVSADPSDPKKRVYWPLGSTERSEPAPSETSLCLITDTLEVHREVGPLGVIALFKAQGVFTMEDVDIISVCLGPKQIMRIMFFGLEHGNDKVLTEAFSSEIARLRGGMGGAIASLGEGEEEESGASAA